MPENQLDVAERIDHYKHATTTTSVNAKLQHPSPTLHGNEHFEPSVGQLLIPWPKLMFEWPTLGSH